MTRAAATGDVELGFFTELREDLDPPYLCQMAA
jgi:hypothetical protein